MPKASLEKSCIRPFCQFLYFLKAPLKRLWWIMNRSHGPSMYNLSIGYRNTFLDLRRFWYKNLLHILGPCRHATKRRKFSLESCLSQLSYGDCINFISCPQCPEIRCQVQNQQGRLVHGSGIDKKKKYQEINFIKKYRRHTKKCVLQKRIT